MRHVLLLSYEYCIASWFGRITWVLDPLHFVLYQFWDISMGFWVLDLGHGVSWLFILSVYSCLHMASSTTTPRLSNCAKLTRGIHYHAYLHCMLTSWNCIVVLPFLGTAKAKYRNAEYVLVLWNLDFCRTRIGSQSSSIPEKCAERFLFTCVINMCSSRLLVTCDAYGKIPFLCRCFSR